MRQSEVAFILLLAIASWAFPGCGNEGNTVIQPTVQYEPTADEQQAAEQAERERAKEDAVGR